MEKFRTPLQNDTIDRDPEVRRISPHLVVGDIAFVVLLQKYCLLTFFSLFSTDSQQTYIK